MLIVYDSMTGNIKRFISRLNLDVIQLHDNIVINEPFILVTYTTGLGEVPNSTIIFLEDNHQLLKGVASSGNKNFGKLFAIAADTISREYHIPVLLKFELSGTKQDTEKFIQEVNHIDRNENP